MKGVRVTHMLGGGVEHDARDCPGEACPVARDVADLQALGFQPLLTSTVQRVQCANTWPSPGA